MEHDTYIILGATSAIAIATARRLATKGAKLALVARNKTKLADLAADLKVRGAFDVQTIATDLVEGAPPAKVYADIKTKLGPVSGILLFYGLLGNQETAIEKPDHALEIIDVNFRSAAGWIIEGAKLLEESPAEKRVMIGISSVAADRGRRSNYVYGAAKSGLNVLLQGLAHQWAGQKGQPRAVSFKLGFVDTPMTDDFDKSGPLWAKPDAIGARIEAAIKSGGPIIYAPWFWRWIMLAIRCTPNFIFKRVNL